MSDSKLIECFLSNAKQFPNAIAIKQGDEEISYSALLEKAFLVSSYIKREYTEQKWVIINGSEGIQSYIWILGCWLAGKGYAPIIKSYSKARFKQLLTLVGHHEILSTEPIDGFVVINPFEHKVEVNQEVVFSENAYLLLTSGSTGAPKPVPIKHRNLNAFFEHYAQLAIGTNDTVLQTYDLTFDVSVFMFGITWLKGSCLTLLPQNGVKYINVLRLLKDESIAVVSMVPSILTLAGKYISELTYPSLKYSFFSGDALPGTLALAWMEACPNAVVFNSYGPCETTIVCTDECLNDLDPTYFNEQPLPLGTPFSGTELLLRDSEILIAGTLVFDGYMDRDTAWDSINGKDYYKSGDTGYYDENNKLIFTGRKDDQVQVNGYRVELDEVSLCAERYTKTKAQTIKVTSNGSDALFCFVLKNDSTIDDIMKFMEAQLPKYMLPKKIILVNKFPYNINGKVDKAALKALAEN